jgi:uncharacterized protein with HEPN domain
MTRGKDFTLLLDDLLGEIEFLADACAGKTVDDLVEDRVLAHAVKYALLSIGEAAKRVPADLRAAHPEIPWREMAQTRDFLAHGYDVVRVEVLWKTMHDDILPLASPLAAAREAERKRRQA